MNATLCMVQGLSTERMTAFLYLVNAGVPFFSSSREPGSTSIYQMRFLLLTVLFVLRFGHQKRMTTPTSSVSGATWRRAHLPYDLKPEPPR